MEKRSHWLLFWIIILFPVFLSVNRESAGQDAKIWLGPMVEDASMRAEVVSAEGDESLWGDESLFEEDDMDSVGTDQETPLHFGFHLWNKFAADTEDDNGFESDLYNHVRGIASAEYLHSDRFYAKVAVQGDYFFYHYDKGWENDDELRIRDAYVNFSGVGYNFKIGNQIVRWGKADGFSPLDNINPEDFRDGIAGRREDRKIDVLMANLQAYRGPVTIQGVFVPFFVNSEMDIAGTDWSIFGHMDRILGPFSWYDPKYSASIRDSQFGGRIAGTFGGFDVALSYFDKIQDLPSFESLYTPPGFVFNGNSIRDLPRFAYATDQTIQFIYDRTSIWGLELETVFGDVVARADLAYKDHVNFLTDSLQRVDKPIFEYLVGFDYNSADNFYINMQFGQTIIDDWDGHIVFAKRTTSALIGTVSREFRNGDFKPELRFYCDLDGDAHIFNPRLLICCWQNIVVDIGAEFFGGEDWTLVGNFKDNDQVYAIFDMKL